MIKRTVCTTLILTMFGAMVSAAGSLPNPAEWWTSKSDEYVWNWIPDLKIHGQAHGNWGCPTCGEKIFLVNIHYPWI